MYSSPSTTSGTTGGASRFSTPPATATGTGPQRPAPVHRSADSEELPAGRLIGSLVAGLLVGALCLLGWRWVWDTLHFNISFIAIGVGFVIGFVMLAVAQKENTIVQISALVLGLGYSIAGVWPSLTGGRITGILFGVLCIFLGAGAAIKAASGGADDSD